METLASDPQSAPTTIGGASQHNLFALTLGSVGVVYGDIGTSPLYAFREAVLSAQDSGPLTQTTVLGVLSLILWSLIIVVTLKYVLILLRADNNGEGGTLSLTALATRAIGKRTPLVFILGVIGASMFLGDSVITPAISVLSAVEGLKLAAPPISAISAASRSRPRGSSSCCRRYSSIISGKAQNSWPIRPRSSTRSTKWSPSRCWCR